jgi:hypothetical protein
MLFESIFKKIFLTLMTVGMTTSCSGAKFAGGSGKDSGATTEQPTEQPEDVAGGFGLTCMPADNADDPLKTDFTCTFLSNDGSKFQETTDQKVDLQVQASDKTVAFNAQDPAAPSSFKFTVLKSEVANITIAVKVVNPQNGNKVKGELNKGLPDVIDTTPPNAPNVAGTSTPTANTTPTWAWSSGGGGGNSVYRYKLNDNNLSTGATQTRDTTWSPSPAFSEATHTLYVQERDAAGNWSTSGSFAIQVVNPPATPTLSPPTRYQTYLGLSWASVSGATSYNLYWSNSSGVTNGSTQIAGVTSVYNHASRTAGTTYYYRLAAVKNGLESALSSEVNATTYTYAAPTVTSILPNSGQLTGGTIITITGTGFQSGVTVSIGGNLATNVNRVTANAITATTPSGSTGAKNVVVTNPDTQTGTLNLGFNYSGFVCSFSTDCYDGAQTLPVNTEVTIDHPTGGSSTTLKLVDGSGSFKVWKEKNGNKILNASGIFANGWQKKLTRAGTSYSNDFLDNPSTIAGRACPEKVFNSSSGPSTCLYYSSRLAYSITLQGTRAGINREDYIEMWTGNAPSGANQSCNYSSNTAASWYVGNIKTCADAGMRLPVLYEFKGWKSGCPAGSSDCAISDLPPDGISESDINGLPARSTWTATASTRCAGSTYDGKYFWQVYVESGPLRTASNGPSNSNAHVLCVLPGF